MPILTGQLLVASPHLRDPNFQRTVVLMLQHENEGALGVVLNRPGDKTVDEVWEIIGSPTPGRDESVFVGGPVPGPLIALHDQREAAEREVFPQLYMSMQRDAIDEIVQNSFATFRLYSGNSGWGAGQLEGELDVGGWLTSPASVDDVFSDPENLWREVCGRIGRKIMAPNLPPGRMPTDPEMN